MRPAGDDVGKVCRPHDSVHAYIVAQLYSDGVIEKAPMSVLLQIFARKTRQPFKSQQPLRPGAADSISLVHLLVKIRNPANVVFGPIDLQLRNSVKDTAQGQL